MSGYGGPDDEAQRASIRVEEQVALARSLMPTGPGTPNCVDCSEPIPEARRKAIPGTRHCVDCQAEKHDGRPTARVPWAT